MEKNKKVTCKTGLKKNILKKDVFDREMALCKKLAQENGNKCGWGVCAKCGVLPLLYKLHKGILLEKPEEIKEIKSAL
ncbi:MAG: hypothetical protein ACD_15C00045G0027 [uncultured bacterium]|nr:MAG: hypothetical protein ACD_15C00045G0027 [uncultured bacterium]HCU70209.1 hypothetical protein [Candidatus Moranbacteria bacterium]